MKRVVFACTLAVLTATFILWAALRNGAEPAPVVAKAQGQRKLRVCADPNNLPFSNEKREGFENRIVELLARDLQADVEYTWWAQRRGYIRNTLKAGECDLIAGIATGVDMLLTTAPYYRSTYVFVYPKNSAIHIDSLDSPTLRKLRIGVQLIGDDYSNTPPAHALARRGIVANVRGYRVTEDYTKPNPPARILDALAAGEIDVAIAWGPLAGYFARATGREWNIVPVSPQVDLPFLPFVYDIGMGVRRGEDGFRQELEKAVERRRKDIDRILQEYGVPRLDV